MNWFVDWTKKAKRQVKALDLQMKRRVKKEINEAAKSENPREGAKRLKGNYAGKWRYRIGDYRAIVEFNNATRVIKVTKVEPRDTVYRHTKIYRISEPPLAYQPAILPTT